MIVSARLYENGAVMRAVVFTAEKRLAIEDRDIPMSEYKEILIKTAMMGICGTDTHVFDGEFEGTAFPLVPGHEATGTIIEMGAGANTALSHFPIAHRLTPN